MIFLHVFLHDVMTKQVSFVTKQVSFGVFDVTSEDPFQPQMPALCSFGAGSVCGHCQSASEHVWAIAGQAGDYSAVWLHT